MQVVCQTVNRKGLVPLRVNEQDPLTAATKAKSKVGVGASNRLAGGGKENARGKLAVSQKSSGRDIAARDIVREQTGKKQSISRKGDKTGFTGPKVQMTGNPLWYITVQWKLKDQNTSPTNHNFKMNLF